MHWNCCPAVQVTTLTQPWLPFAESAASPRLTADSGGASFLPEAVAALRELQADAGLACGSIQQPQDAVDNAYNSSAVFDIKVATPDAAPPVDVGAPRCARAPYPPRQLASPGPGCAACPGCNQRRLLGHRKRQLALLPLSAGTGDDANTCPQMHGLFAWTCTHATLGFRSAGEFDLLSAAVAAAYPPRGTLPLLPPHLERCPATSPTMDCLLVQVRLFLWHSCLTPQVKGDCWQRCAAMCQSLAAVHAHTRSSNTCTTL